MFSVGNHYLVPTINGEVKYQPKVRHVSSYRIMNWKRERLYATRAIFTSILGPEYRGEFKFPPANSSYFIKRSKLTSLCPCRSGHYTD